MLTLLRTRRWIAFTLLVVVAIVGFGLLSRWQWQRAEERRIEHQALDAAAAATPISLTRAISAPSEWQTVTVAGSYVPDSTVLVRQRPLDGANGFWVMTLLNSAEGDVWVNRGWLPSIGAATAPVAAPAPPGGEVSIIGRLRWAQVAPEPVPTDLPVGQVSDADPVLLGGGQQDFYLEAVSSTPREADLTLLPAPTIDEGRNVSYAVQWVIFAAIALIGWFYFLRREARENHAAEPAQLET